MKTFKAFNKDLTCRDFQFEIGQTYTHEGEIKACASGFHSCENPLDVLNYYDFTTSRFCVVTVSGDIKTHTDDSKIASSVISIDKELTLSEFIKEAVKYIKAANTDTNCVSSGDNSKLAASGDNSKLAASGYNIQLAASGYNSQLAASGYNSKLAASGNYSQLVASGYNSKLAASGDNSKLAASGNYSQLVASGENSVAICAGLKGKVKGGIGSLLVLAYWDNINNHYDIKRVIVGKNHIKPDTWYTLDENNKIVKC